MGLRSMARFPHATLQVKKAWTTSLTQELVHWKHTLVVDAQKPLVWRLCGS